MNPAAVPILMYHSVSEEPTAATRGLSVHPVDFERQLGLLSELGYTSISFGALVRAWRTAAREGGSRLTLPERPVVLTFDDGYADFHSEVLPRLERYQATATLFVTTGWISTTDRPEDEDRLAPMVNWSQLREIASAGVEVGAHSESHPELDRISARELNRQVGLCKEELDNGLEQHTDVFCYPYGYANARVRESVRAAGYIGACVVGNAMARYSQGPYALTRMTIDRRASLRKVEDVVEGRSVSRIYLKERALTKSYAAFRRSRNAVLRSRGGG
ncbi:MAG TPA: polysaccharide deacetylase family protein [Actinospica sp.]|nr:polysaccharide deacetylase family protein [Actinospica sp.]